MAALSPPLDASLLRRELTQTWDELLAPRGLTGEPPLAAALARALDALCAELAAPAPVPCHRDLMARNLVPLPGGAVGVLDHQDLRLGPPRYDLASLLNDSLFPPPEVEEAILAGVLRGDEDRLRYRRAAAQRTLKAAGTFAAFARRGSDRHLGLIPPTLARACGHLSALPETAELAPELAPPLAAGHRGDLLECRQAVRANLGGRASSGEGGEDARTTAAGSLGRSRAAGDSAHRSWCSSAPTSCRRSAAGWARASATSRRGSRRSVPKEKDGEDDD